MPGNIDTGTEAGKAVSLSRQHCSLHTEQAIRKRLSIPDWAERVMIVAESTHWDPDWVLTSGEYYKYMVRRALERAVTELQKEERRVFDVECVFFLRKYFERSPHRQEAIRTLVNTGRIKFTGSGITTPDTLLPTEEALVRDLLTGRDWLHANGMPVDPRTLYLPDSFGHTPCLPSVAKSCGIHSVAFTRIDGMHSTGLEYSPKSHYPRLMSSEEMLQSKSALDFIWKDSNGSEILAHWNAFNYGHGDMIAGHGSRRDRGMYQGVPDRSDTNVTRKIEKFARELDRYSPTPYLLLTMGLDFTIPLKGLVALLDRYNELHGRQSGLFVVNAGLDDYFELVRCHTQSLPVVALDPNPYFMGFYGSRLPLKRMHRRITDYLIASETIASVSGNMPLAQRLAAGNSQAWEIASVGNHHDLITGTGSDRVYHKEQRPWLLHALGIARQAVRDASQSSPPTHTPSKSPPVQASQPSWSRAGDILSVETQHLRIRFDLSRGGIISSCVGISSGLPLLDHCGELVSLEDSGGMWRLGNESAGGTLSEVSNTSTGPAHATVRSHRGGVEITLDADLEGRPTRRIFWISADEPFVAVHCEVIPRRHRSVIIHFTMPPSPYSPQRPLTLDSHPVPRAPFVSGPRYSDSPSEIASHSSLIMAQPGGTVTRPLERHFQPTFWPLNGWAHIHAPGRSRQDLTIASLCSTGISVSRSGTVMLMAGRNPGKERALGLVPFLVFPAAYREKERCVLDCAVLFRQVPSSSDAVVQAATDAGSGAFEQLIAHVEPVLSSLRNRIGRMVTIQPSRVKMIAAKPATDGNGIIIRVGTAGTCIDTTGTDAGIGISTGDSGQDAHSQDTVTISFNSITPEKAQLCSAMENYIAELPVAGNSIFLDRKHLRGSTATVRIVTGDDSMMGWQPLETHLQDRMSSCQK
ncbi:MAG: hypothetical protein M1399_06870 [Actinobacteria bacterium]|nr:hypothetical protein [Actinomycetota bacterium]MCL5446106.1 hypothetical protein [Actinomycetota bacterium]